MHNHIIYVLSTLKSVSISMCDCQMFSSTLGVVHVPCSGLQNESMLLQADSHDLEHVSLNASELRLPILPMPQFPHIKRRGNGFVRTKWLYSFKILKVGLDKR